MAILVISPSLLLFFLATASTCAFTGTVTSDRILYIRARVLPIIGNYDHNTQIHSSGNSLRRWQPSHTTGKLTSLLSSKIHQNEQEGEFDVSSYMFPDTYNPGGSDYDDDNNNMTKDFILQQTMIRVKDPIRSLDFYCKILGFRLIHYSEFPQWKFNVYFVAPLSALTSTNSNAVPITIPCTRTERWNLCMTTPGCIELTWNYGTEKEGGGMVYNTGNADGTGVTRIPSSTPSPSTSLSSSSSSSSSMEKEDEHDVIYKVRGGFGHLGITVPNVYDACARFHSLGVQFHKSPNMGGMKGLAFIKDPDGYLIEVLPQGPMVTQDVDCLGVGISGDDGEGYKDNSK